MIKFTAAKEYSVTGELAPGDPDIMTVTDGDILWLEQAFSGIYNDKYGYILVAKPFTIRFSRQPWTLGRFPREHARSMVIAVLDNIMNRLTIKDTVWVDVSSWSENDILTVTVSIFVTQADRTMDKNLHIAWDAARAAVSCLFTDTQTTISITVPADKIFSIGYAEIRSRIRKRLIDGMEDRLAFKITDIHLNSDETVTVTAKTGGKA